MARPRDPARAKRGTGNRPQTPAGAAEVVPYGRRDTGVFLPDPPSDLPPAAHDLWRTVVAEVAERGLKPADVEAVRQLVITAHRHHEVTAKINQYGILIRGNRGGTVVNPLIKVERELARTYLTQAESFGLTYAARLRLGLMQLAGASILQTLSDDLDTEWA